MIVSALLALCWTTAAPAAVTSSTPVEFSFDFDSTKRGVSALAHLHLRFFDPRAPDDPEGKSPPLRRVAVTAPRGTRFHRSAVPACEATDLKLRIFGAAACRSDSDVGTGNGSVWMDPGPPLPVWGQGKLFAHSEGITEVLTFAGAVHVVDRAEFKGLRRLVFHPPLVPGFTERSFDYDIGQRAADTDHLITSPRSCPRTGEWKSRVTYIVTTGQTYTATSGQPCRVRPPRK